MFWSLKNKGIRHISANGLLHLSVPPFNDRPLQLANIFSDQSVIVIENALIVSELRSKD